MKELTGSSGTCIPPKCETANRKEQKEIATGFKEMHLHRRCVVRLHVAAASE
jgi:hypothetical protein